MTSYPSLRLKKHEERRLQKGHLWIYSNEVDIAKTPLKSFTAGQLVQVEQNTGKPLGIAYLNPHTLLCARLLSRSLVTIDQSLLEQRLEHALQLRQELFKEPYYRLVYGEADALPGLIVDRYNDVLVVQITTAGMEGLKTQILGALQKVLAPGGILLRNDHAMRALEGMPSYIEEIGIVPPKLELIENGLRFCISPWEGQKTGWFYDHRENRAQLKRFVNNKRVLDLFSYVGGWGVQAAAFGAKEVVMVDSSAPALAIAQHNALLNQVSDKLQCHQADVFDQLKEFAEDRQRFDVIILDPPAFVKKAKDLAAGLNAYHRVNALALRLLTPGGYLISSSCSQHFSQAQLREVILSAACNSHRMIQVVAQGHQAADHPIHPAIPETEYLKTLFCHSLP